MIDGMPKCFVIVTYVEGYVYLGWGAGTHIVTSQSLGVPTTQAMAAPLNLQSPLLQSHAPPTEAVYRSMGYPGKETKSTLLELCYLILVLYLYGYGSNKILWLAELDAWFSQWAQPCPHLYVDYVNSTYMYIATGMGTSCVMPPTREQSSQLPVISSGLPSDPTPDATRSPQPQAPVTTFRPPAPPVAACAPVRADPILNIIKESVAKPLSFAVSGPPSPWEASTSNPVANSSGIVNSSVSQECSPSLVPGADPPSHGPCAALTPEDVAVQISPRAGPSNVPSTQPGGHITASQEHSEIVPPRVIPASVIYLSDSDDD